MKSKINRRQEKKVRNTSSQDILILTDGRILTHNLTSAMAVVLRELNPDDPRMRQRCRDLKGESTDELRAGT
jgi:hypothetical protein